MMGVVSRARVMAGMEIAMRMDCFKAALVVAIGTGGFVTADANATARDELERCEECANGGRRTA